MSAGLTVTPPRTILDASQLKVAAHLSLDLRKAFRIIFEILGSG